MNTETIICCTFCSKNRKDVEFLIAAGKDSLAAICEECVSLSVEIITEERQKKLDKKKGEEMSVDVENKDKPGTYRKVRLVELREGERIVRDTKPALQEALEQIEKITGQAPASAP